jgi:hypothetical protein
MAAPKLVRRSPHNPDSEDQQLMRREPNNRAESVDWWRALFAGGRWTDGGRTREDAVRLSRRSAARKRQAGRRRACFKRALIANQAPAAECNTVELFDVIHRPSIDIRPFARSNNRRAPAPIERRSCFITAVEAAAIGRIDERNLRWECLRLSVSKAVRLTSPRRSVRHAGRFSPTVTRRCDRAC